MPVFYEFGDFVYCLLKFILHIFADIAQDKQITVLGHVIVKDLKREQIVIPSENVVTDFNSKINLRLKKIIFKKNKTKN